MHYVIGDVHGCYDEMTVLLAKIEAQDPEASLIFVGDLIDRGPKVWEVLDWAVGHITLDGKYQTVRGNHEQMVIDWYHEFEQWWQDPGRRAGGQMPLTHYDFFQQLEKTDRLSPEKARPYIRFFQGMPFSKRLEIQTVYGTTVTYRIAHAWYDLNEPEDTKKQHYMNIWERDVFGNPRMEEIIIHGHTPTIARDSFYSYVGAPGMICYRLGAVNLDGGCCFAPSYRQYPCMLCALCLETFEEIYPYSVTKRFVQQKGPGRAAGDALSDAQQFQKKYMDKTPLPRLKLLERIGAADNERGMHV